MQGIVSKVCENISSKIAPGFEGYRARLESLEALVKLMRDDAAKAAAHGINRPDSLLPQESRVRASHQPLLSPVRRQAILQKRKLRRLGKRANRLEYPLKALL